MTAALLPNAKAQFIDSTGKPLAGGKVYFYIPNTTTFKNTWQDSAQTILNTNPVVLDANGQALIWGAGSYRQIVNDQFGNLIWDQITQDPTAGVSGNMTDDLFVAGTDFTPGTTTQLTLNAGPGSLANTWIFFDGVFQADPQIQSLNGTVLTFTSPIPVGVQLVTVKIGSTLAIGTVADGSITDSKVAIGSKLYNRITDFIEVKDFGALGNGAADDRAAFAAAEANGKSYFISQGTYRIGSNITLSQKIIFLPGAVLKPDTGVTVTFGENFEAGTSYQIFDLSNSGTFISLPYDLTEVWGEWWGAKGDGVKTNNEVPINQAITALAATATGGSGVSFGVIRLGRGFFYISAPIVLSTQISIKGSHTFYTIIKANVATWAGANMVTATTISGPMFSSRLEDMRLDANAIGSINAVVYSNAWQEKCGMFRCYVANFQANGFSYDTGNGGAAHLRLHQCEFFPNLVNGAAGIAVTVPYTQGWLLLNLSEITVGCPSAPGVSVTGINLSGRVDCTVSGVFTENISNGFILSTGACVSGSGISGGLNQTTVFNCSGSWTGNVNVTGCRLGNATNMVVDTNRNYSIAPLDPTNSNLVWPPSSALAVYEAQFVGGASPSVLYQDSRYGITASISHTSTGIYSVTLSQGLTSSSSYDVSAALLDPAVSQVSISPNTATNFTVSTRNNSGAVTDASNFAIKVYHKA